MPAWLAPLLISGGMGLLNMKSQHDQNKAMEKGRQRTLSGEDYNQILESIYAPWYGKGWTSPKSLSAAGNPAMTPTASPLPMAGAGAGGAGPAAGVAGAPAAGGGQGQGMMEMLRGMIGGGKFKRPGQGGY